MNNNPGYQPGYDPRSPYDEDSNQISGEQVYDRDPRLPTLHEEASDNGILYSNYFLFEFCFVSLHYGC